MSGTKGRSGGVRRGAGPPRKYVITKKPYIGFDLRSTPRPVTSESELTICIAEADDRRGIVINDVWYGYGEALAIADYVEQFRVWLSHREERGITMNGQQFLAALPQLPDEVSFFPDRIPGRELRAVMGEMLFDKKEYVQSTGGAPDDSRRGFGPTSHHWRIPTEKGWSVYYDDNARESVLSATTPDGVRYARHHISIDRGHYDVFFCQEEQIAAFEEAQKTAVESRYTFLHTISEKIPTKYPGYFVQDGWICSDTAGTIYPVFDHTDEIGSLHTKVPPSWWFDGITIQDLF